MDGINLTLNIGGLPFTKLRVWAAPQNRMGWKDSKELRGANFQPYQQTDLFGCLKRKKAIDWVPNQILTLKVGFSIQNLLPNSEVAQQTDFWRTTAVQVWLAGAVARRVENGNEISIKQLTLGGQGKCAGLIIHRSNLKPTVISISN